MQDTAIKICRQKNMQSFSKKKWPLYVWGLMSDLVICKFRKSVVIHDTECPYWDQVSLNKHKPTNQSYMLPLVCWGINHMNQICHKLGTFWLGTFWLWDVLTWDVLTWDVWLWDVLTLGRFDFGTFWVWDVLTWDFLTLGRFDLGRYDFGTFWLGTFWLWDVLTMGRFDIGTFWHWNVLTGNPDALRWKKFDRHYTVSKY